MDEMTTATQHKRLEEKATNVLEIKEKIAGLQQEIVELECQIIDLVGFNTEGTKTVQLDHLSVSTIGKNNRTLNPTKLEEIWPELSQEVRASCIKLKPNLDLKNYRALRNLDDQAWYKLSEAIISKPAKTAVQIKVLEKNE